MQPESIEFRQGDRESPHTRLAYLQDDTDWHRQLLWP
ncbi:pyridoxine 5'-phosphate oxidase C-terminal domain-containing protein [Streptomyces sp. NPDC001107]